VSISLVLGALVLSLVFAIGGHLDAQLRREAIRVAVSEQLSGAAEVLPIDLRGLSPASGDIAIGEARDSSIQLRQTIANALVCGGTASTWILAPFLGAGARSAVPAVEDGDTAWVLLDSDSGEQWRVLRLRAIRRASDSCAAVTDADGATVFDVTHLWAADLRDSLVATPGAVLRVTRPLRFSFYRGGDGRWYLGMRSWSTTTLQFNGIQPVSGPFAAVSGDRGTRFVFFDSAGERINSGAADTRTIARIESVLISDTAPAAMVARESLTVVVALRNRQ
jgi:hypothetical protein